MSVAQKIAELQEAFRKEHGLEIGIVVNIHAHNNVTHFNMADKTLRDISKDLPGEIDFHDNNGYQWHILDAGKVVVSIFYNAD